MKKSQTEEVMLAMMVVMLAVVWLTNGHIGMMGHGSGAADKSAAAEPHDVAKPNAVLEQKQ